MQWIIWCQCQPAGQSSDTIVTYKIYHQQAVCLALSPSWSHQLYFSSTIRVWWRGRGTRTGCYSHCCQHYIPLSLVAQRHNRPLASPSCYTSQHSEYCSLWLVLCMYRTVGTPSLLSGILKTVVCSVWYVNIFYCMGLTTILYQHS